MKLKAVLWSIAAAMTAVVIFQNQALFFGQTALNLNLYLFRFETRAFPLALIALGFMFGGYILATLAYLGERQRNRITIDTLNQQLDRCRVAHLETVETATTAPAASTTAAPLLQGD